MNKITATIVSSLLIVSSLSAQTAVQPADVKPNGAKLAPSGGYYTKSQAEAKVRRYTKMKKNGTRRSIIGGALTVTGIILCASADWETESSGDNVGKTTNDPGGVVGTLMLFPGIPITLTGLIQLGISSTKIQEYSNLFDDTKVSMIIGKEKLGLTVSRNF